MKLFVDNNQAFRNLNTFLFPVKAAKWCCSEENGL